MKRHRTTKAEIPGKVAEIKKLRASGMSVADAVKKAGLSYPAYLTWTKKLGGAKATSSGHSSDVDKLLDQLVEAIRKELLAKLEK